MGKNISFKFDSDGVIARWFDASIEETHQKGYFAERELEKVMRDVVLDLAKDYDVEIFTKTYVDDHSKEDKQTFYNNNGLGNIKVTYIPIDANKWDYVGDTKDTVHVLIDDYKENLEDWREHGQVAIKFFNQKNRLPKVSVDENGVMTLIPDSWTGPSVDYRMSKEDIKTALVAFAEAAAA